MARWSWTPPDTEGTVLALCRLVPTSASSICGATEKGVQTPAQTLEQGQWLLPRHGDAHDGAALRQLQIGATLC